MRHISLGCNWIALGLLWASTRSSSNSRSCDRRDLFHEEMKVGSSAGREARQSMGRAHLSAAQWSMPVNVSMKRARRCINALWHEMLPEGSSVSTIGQEKKLGLVKTIHTVISHRLSLRTLKITFNSSSPWRVRDEKTLFRLMQMLKLRPVSRSLFINVLRELSCYLNHLSAVRQEVFEKTTTRLSVRSGWQKLLLHWCDMRGTCSKIRSRGWYLNIYVYLQQQDKYTDQTDHKRGVKSHAAERPQLSTRFTL